MDVREESPAAITQRASVNSAKPFCSRSFSLIVESSQSRFSACLELYQDHKRLLRSWTRKLNICSRACRVAGMQDMSVRLEPTLSPRGQKSQLEGGGDKTRLILTNTNIADMVVEESEKKSHKIS